MKVHKPIIIIGVERSGKSLLASILANHPNLYWLSNLDSRWPTGTIPITLARRIFSWTKIDQKYITNPGTFSRMQGKFPPSECLPYWKRVFKWGNEEDYLIESDYFDEKDLTAEMSHQLINDLSLRVSLSGKSRLMLDQAGFSLKILFFNALFPDAIFLQVIRNPFDNHEALVQRKLRSEQKLWGIKIPGWKELIDEDPYKQAAIQMKFTLQIIDEDITKIPNFETRFMRIPYENLVSIPRETVQSVLDFCDLGTTPRILAALKGVKKETENHHATGSRKCQGTSDVLISLAQKYGYLAFKEYS